MTLICFFCLWSRWMTTRTAPPCLCKPHCGRRWDCICTVNCCVSHPLYMWGYMPLSCTFLPWQIKGEDTRNCSWGKSKLWYDFCMSSAYCTCIKYSATDVSCLFSGHRAVPESCSGRTEWSCLWGYVKRVLWWSKKCEQLNKSLWKNISDVLIKQAFKVIRHQPQWNMNDFHCEDITAIDSDQPCLIAIH